MSSTLRVIWRLMAGQRLRYAAAVLALVIASCFLYLAPLVPQATIDGAIAQDPAAASTLTRRVVSLLGGREFLLEHLWVPALLVAGITGLAGVFTYLRGRWAAEASEAIVRRLRDRLYDHLQHLRCAYLDQAETGDLIQRCTSDVETVRVFLATQTVEIGRALIMLFVPIPLMLAIDVRMTVASLVLLPLVFVFSLVFFRRVKRVFLETDEAEGRLTSTIQENLTGIRVVRAFARQAFEEEKLAARNAEHRDLHYRLYVLLAHFWSLSDLLALGQKALVVGTGAVLLAQGELGVGAFYYFLSAVALFLWPVRMLGRILADLGKAVVALERIEEVLGEPVEPAPEVPVPLPAAAKLGGEVVFEGVDFAYGESAVLRDVSFRIAEGETLGLLGPSGAGKSTIVSLLLRLYDYEQGSIRLGGHELARLDRKQVRQNIAAVLQGPFLYSKTLRDNVTMGAPEADEEAMVTATRAASVHDAVSRFDGGYDTVVGERGVTLSGGQRQRLALARALLQDPAVLILDDALSAVDTETESAILEALARRRGRCTTILIAHRLSTLMQADRILVLDEGRVVAQGTHQSLLAQDGLYRRLWELQGQLDEPRPQVLLARSA